MTPPGFSRRPEPPMDEWVVIARLHPAKVHIARGVLEAHDIPVQVVDEFSPVVPSGIAVPRARQEEACLILDEFPGLFRWWEEPADSAP